MSTSVSSAKKRSLGPVSGSLATLVERRWLIWYFVQRQLSRSYRNSFLGILWLVLSPLLMIVLYTLVFSEFLGLRFREGAGAVNFGLYLYCGLIPFMAYGDTVNQSVRSIRSNSTLVQKVVFPLEILPLSAAATAIISQVFGFGMLIFLVALLEHQLHWTAVLIPLMMVPQLLFVLGLSFLGAVVGTYLPDVRETLRAVVRATFFITPILWPADRVPDDLRFLVDYNPIAYLVESYRALVLEGRLPDMSATLWFTLFAGALCLAGFLLFVRVKERFADLV
ncbi:MAG TPA: ABC transporter permease [Rubrobacter sp.]|nr:ABC transporter permease [Rubrobacter sp.]